MSKDDEIKKLKAENKQLKAENEKLKAEKKLFSQLLWDNGLEQAQFLDNITEKRQISRDNFKDYNENKDTTLRDTAEAHIAYFEWLFKQYMKKGKGMNEKDARSRARDDTADLVKVITGTRPGQTLRYKLYPAPRDKIS